MQARRETKRHIIAIQTMLRSTELEEEERQVMELNISDLRKQLNVIEAKVNKDEIKARREFLNKNKGLKEIFEAFWLTYMSFAVDGYLSKEGYYKFNHGIQIALVGYNSFDEMSATINNEWSHDKMLFGPFDKNGFFDLLFETIETWTEIVDPTYYAAFAWSLLDTMADTTTHPPRLRPLREITCITKMSNEANMIRSYIKNKKVRAALALESEVMARVPDVQKRLRARKLGADITDDQKTMIEVLSKSASLSTKPMGDSLSINSRDGDSSGDESTKSRTTASKNAAKENSLISVRDMLMEENDDGRFDDEEDDENEDEEGESQSDGNKDDDNDGDDALKRIRIKNVPFRQVAPNRDKRTSTISFMEYVKARREMRNTLNGGLGSSLESSLTRSQARSGASGGGGGDMQSINSGLSEDSDETGDSWSVGRHMHKDGVDYGNYPRGDGYGNLGDYTKYERKISRRFEKFVKSGKRFSTYKDSQGNYPSLSTMVAGALGAIEGVAMERRSILNQADGREYVAIDIDEVNRQLRQQGQTFGTGANGKRLKIPRSRGRKNQIVTVGDHKTLIPRPKKSLAEKYDPDYQRIPGPVSNEESYSMTDDVSSMISESSLLQQSVSSYNYSHNSANSGSTMSNRDYIRKIERENDLQKSQLTAILHLDPNSVTTNNKKKTTQKMRTETFMSISGNTLLQPTHQSLKDGQFQLAPKRKTNNKHFRGKVKHLAPLPVQFNISGSSNLQSHSFPGNASGILVSTQNGDEHEIAAPTSQMRSLYNACDSALRGSGGGGVRLDKFTDSVDRMDGTEGLGAAITTGGFGTNSAAAPADWQFQIDNKHHLSVSGGVAVDGTMVQVSSPTRDRQIDTLFDSSATNLLASPNNGMRNNAQSPSKHSNNINSSNNGTNMLTTLRPLSPAQQAMNTKYHAAFPHGKYSEILTTAQSLRATSPSANLPTWDHTRATKALKLNPHAAVNQYALNIVTKPMTLRDNMKVAKELQLTQLKHNNHNTKNINFDASTAKTPSNYVLSSGELPTMAMHTLTGNQPSKFPAPVQSYGPRILGLPYQSNTILDHGFEPKNSSLEGKSSLDAGFTGQMLDEMSSLDCDGGLENNNKTHGLKGGECGFSETSETETPHQLHPQHSPHINSNNESRTVGKDKTVGTSLSMPSLTMNYTDHSRYGIPIVLDHNVSDKLLETYNLNMLTHTLGSAALKPNSSSSSRSINNKSMKNLKSTVSGVAGLSRHVSVYSECGGGGGGGGGGTNRSQASSAASVDQLDIVRLINIAKKQPVTKIVMGTTTSNPNSPEKPTINSDVAAIDTNTKTAGADKQNNRNDVTNTTGDVEAKTDVVVVGGVRDILRIDSAMTDYIGTDAPPTTESLSANDTTLEIGPEFFLLKQHAVGFENSTTEPNSNAYKAKLTKTNTFGSTFSTHSLLQDSAPGSFANLLSKTYSMKSMQLLNTASFLLSPTAGTATATNGGGGVYGGVSNTPGGFSAAIIGANFTFNSLADPEAVKGKEMGFDGKKIRKRGAPLAVSAPGSNILHTHKPVKVDTNNEQLKLWKQLPVTTAAAPHASMGSSLVSTSSGVGVGPVGGSLSVAGTSSGSSTNIGHINRQSTVNTSRDISKSKIGLSVSQPLPSSKPTAMGDTVVESPETAVTNSVSAGNSAEKEQSLAQQQQQQQQQQSASQVNLAGIPWIPRGTLKPLDHNRSSHILGWREKNDLLQHFPVDNTEIRMTIKSQNAVRDSFEKYVKGK